MMIKRNCDRKVNTVSLVLFFLLAAGATGFTAAEEATDFRYERVISLNPATAGPDSVVEITLTPQLMGKPYRNISEEAADLRFVSADTKQPLKYWIEKWDPTGNSTIWVKVEKAGTAKVMMLYGNPRAESQSNGEGVFDFFDDFNNGIWTKPVDYPIYTPSMDRNYPDAGRKLGANLCEPSVIFEDGIFKMWYSSEELPWKGLDRKLPRGMAYATSKDGILWERYPKHPLIVEEWPDSICRCYVMKHKDTYYHFAINVEMGEGSIIRWTSKDGIHWEDKVKVLTPSANFIGQLFAYQNPAVFVDDDGTWKMLINNGHGTSLATSKDGLHWTKWNDGAAVLTPGGDPFVKKIGDTYFCWHSEQRGGPLCISVSWSKDLIHWTSGPGYKNPQIGHTQPWERGLGTVDIQCDEHIADAHLVEHGGKIWMYYCGTQSQFGVATFDGTWEELAERTLHNPPLSKWRTESMFGAVDGKELRMSDDASKIRPLVVNAATFSDAEGYIFEFRARSCGGASYQMMPVVRYVNDNFLGRFQLHNNETTWYQEVRERWKNGQVASIGTINTGPNDICDHKWHNWRIVVKNEKNTLYIDDRLIGSCESMPQLVNRTDLKVGFSTFDTFAAFDNVRVRKYSEPEIICKVSISEENK